MKPHAWMTAALACGLAGVAQAQPADFGLSVGLKAWRAQWTTFSFDTNGGGQQVVTQVPAKDETVLIPQLSARYRSVVASLSRYQPTDHDFVAGGGNRRKEIDVNVGYLVTPAVALTLGYKKVGQSDGTDNYELAGAVLGASATAPLGGGFALYGSFGIGRMKDTAASTVKFDADYRLTEVGLAYGLPLDGWLKTLTFTAGYRTQVLSSKEALGDQDGRDLTQGLAFAVLASF